MNFQEVAGIGAYILGSLGGAGAIIFGLSGHLGRVWADRALETLRQEHAVLISQLSHQLALLTEERKHNLQLQATEHQVRFAKLHEKRAVVLSALAKRLYEIQIEGERFVGNIGQGGDEAFFQWKNKAIECRSFLERHEMYLTDRISTAVYQFLGRLQTAVVNVWTVTDSASGSQRIPAEHRKVVLAAVKELDQDIPSLRRKLIEEFRTLLGGAATG